MQKATLVANCPLCLILWNNVITCCGPGAAKQECSGFNNFMPLRQRVQISSLHLVCEWGLLEDTMKWMIINKKNINNVIVKMLILSILSTSTSDVFFLIYIHCDGYGIL